VLEQARSYAMANNTCVFVPELLTGVNGPAGSTFNFSGGVINDGGSAYNGWYGADNANHPFNFTAGSTGVINFLGSSTTVSQVTSWLTVLAAFNTTETSMLRHSAFCSQVEPAPRSVCN